mmetsp:Transcript_35218/g.73318  ORF Transcript_35218/g.73318 Transcript_35218/m.73318 type:complete len:121 (+) Transcript_35218:672-1034(+)
MESWRIISSPTTKMKNPKRTFWRRAMSRIVTTPGSNTSQSKSTTVAWFAWVQLFWNYGTTKVILTSSVEQGTCANSRTSTRKFDSPSTTNSAYKILPDSRMANYFDDVRQGVTSASLSGE